MKVLFVCTGNMCRSPAAEKLLARFGASRGFETRSRGTGVQPYSGLHRKIAALLKNEGIEDLSHKAAQVSEPDVDWADLILVMEEAHRDILGDAFPQSLRKTHLFLDYCGGEGDLPDPMGGSDRDFAEAVSRIRDCVLKLADKKG